MSKPLLPDELIDELEAEHTPERHSRQKAQAHSREFQGRLTRLLIILIILVVGLIWMAFNL